MSTIYTDKKRAKSWCVLSRMSASNQNEIRANEHLSIYCLVGAVSTVSLGWCLSRLVSGGNWLWLSWGSLLWLFIIVRLLLGLDGWGGLLVSWLLLLEIRKLVGNQNRKWWKGYVRWSERESCVREPRNIQWRLVLVERKVLVVRRSLLR